jgi:hypothetical protein
MRRRGPRDASHERHTIVVLARNGDVDPRCSFRRRSLDVLQEKGRLLRVSRPGSAQDDRL